MANKPFIENGNAGIKEPSDSEFNAMLARIAYLYQQDPTVILNVVTSNGNISPNMTDRRYKSGTAKRDTTGEGTAFPSQAATGEPEIVTGVTYDKIDQVVSEPAAFGSSDYNSMTAKPVYLAEQGGLREMSFSNVLTYFIDPWVNNLTATNNTGVEAGGAHFISTASSESNSTNLGTVFADTRANAGGYLAENIGTANTRQDVFSTTTFRLFRVNSNLSSQGSGYRTPLCIDYSSNKHGITPAGLRHMTYAEFDALFAPLAKRAVFDYSGFTLRYNVNGSGTRQGTRITNREMTGVSGKYTQYKATIDDYRAQEFPNGTLVVRESYDLKLQRT